MDDFIYAADTGRDIGGGIREIQYSQADAVLTGVEGEASYQLTEATRLGVFGDHVRGKLRDGGDLPRIPADRLGVRLDQRLAPQLAGQVEFYRVQRQDRTAAFENDTGGYNMLGASLIYGGRLESTDYQLYLKGNNLLDARGRNHSSFIKDEVVLPGRNLTLGVRFAF
ncbi:putative TonB-dependent receptor precursor [compost metagenome]